VDGFESDKSAEEFDTEVIIIAMNKSDHEDFYRAPGEHHIHDAHVRTRNRLT